MPAQSDYSLADILSQMMIYDGVVSDSSETTGQPSGDWPVYVNGEPEPSNGVPDEVVTVYDSGAGAPNLRDFVDGDQVGADSFQIRVRSQNRQDGYSKIKELSDYLCLVRNNTTRRGVSIGNKYYLFHGAVNVGPVIYLGNNQPSGKHHIYVLNGSSCVSDRTP